MEEVKLGPSQVLVAEACIAFVRQRFPEHDIGGVSIGDDHGELGYLPSITVCPKGNPGHGGTELGLQVWVGEGPFLAFDEVVYEIENTGNSPCLFYCRNSKCPRCGGSRISFTSDRLEPAYQMRCTDCTYQGAKSDFA